MFSPVALSGFIAASVLLALAPGPDNLFVLAVSAAKGPKAGLMTTLGLCTGLIGHTAAVTLGVAAFIAATPAAFTAIKIFGAAYLVFLAAQAFRAGPEPIDATAPSVALRAYYLRGVLMNLGNPKVAIFFLAFLPQFISADKGGVPLQLAVLGLIFLLCALASFSAIALAAGKLGGWLGRSPRNQIVLNRLAGGLFLALAARLALAKV